LHKLGSRGHTLRILTIVIVLLLPTTAIITPVEKELSTSKQTLANYYDLKYTVLNMLFTPRIIDTVGNVGLYTSIDLDSNENPHISYYDETKGDLKYARWTGFGWLVETVDSDGDVGLYTSLALDVSNRPHISYYKRTNGELRYARHNGIQFQIQVVDDIGDAGLYTSLALNSSNSTYISYYEKTGGSLRLAKLNGTIWETEDVDDSDDVGLYTSIALDFEDSLHITYYDATNGDLKYIKRTKTGWWIAPRIIDSRQDVGLYSSLVIGAEDLRYVSYYDKTNGDQKFACFGNWAIGAQRVDSVGVVGEYTSIALDSVGQPHITYYDRTERNIKYAARRDGSWHLAKIQEERDSGLHSSMVMDSRDRLHVSYAASTFYGSRDPAVGTDCDQSENCSYVHVVWRELIEVANDVYHLIYYRRSPDKGRTWDIPMFPLSSEWRHFAGYPAFLHTEPPAISVAGETIHVAWAREYRIGFSTGYGIFYQQSKDNGETWLDEEIRIDDIPSVGMSGGFPSFVSIYADDSYVNAAWERDMKVYSVRSLVGEATTPEGWKDDIGKFSSIALDVLGQPYIASFDSTRGDLIFSGSPGDGVFDTQIVDRIGNVGQYTSLALDNRNYPYPHISYYDETQGDLKYARWDGTGWLIETVESAGKVGLYASLDLDSSNCAHIAYHDETRGDLKYAKWNGTAWVITTVDDLGTVGQYASLALDGDDRPHISYYDNTTEVLKYAHWNGTAWTIQIVDNSAEVGEYSSLALDSEDLPHISYYDETNQNLKYAHHNGTDWNAEVVDFSNQVGEFTSIDLDSEDNPHISYYDRGQTRLKYAFLGATGWQVSVLDNSGDVGKHSSIALGPNDNLHVSYYDETNQELKHYSVILPWLRHSIDQDEMVSYPIWGAARGKYQTAGYPQITGENGNLSLIFVEMVTPRGDLKYATWNGTNWNVERVDEEEVMGLFTSLALDSSDNPHISYYDETEGQLKYAKWTGTGWQTEVVDNQGDVGLFTSITLDSKDYPHITYVDYWDRTLKYARWDGGKWHTEVVGTEFSSAAGWYSSIALDTNDRPHISYYSWAGGMIYYVTFNGTSWNFDLVTSRGWQHNSIALDSNDRPHISYGERRELGLGYSYWNGTDWVKYVVDDSSPYVGTHSSIALDENDEPMFSYFDVTRGDLKFARPGLTAWDTERVDSSFKVGLSSSLAVDDYGVAHISYYDETEGDLKYAKWVPGGWSIESVDTDGDTGMYTSLALDSTGYPHISYYDESDGFGLFHVRGLTSGNDSWAPPVLITEKHGAIPANPSVAVEGQYLHTVWADSGGAYWGSHIYYKRSSDYGQSFPDAEMSITDEPLFNEWSYTNPQIQVSGATVHILWQRREMIHVGLYNSEVMYDRNRFNGETDRWGKDYIVDPDPPLIPITYANNPKLQVVGNDGHMIWTLGTPEEVPEIIYLSSIDELSMLGELDSGKKGTSSVYAYSPNDLRNKIFIIGGETSTGYSANVTKVDPTNGSVEDYCLLPKGLAYTSAVWDGQDSIFVFGGLSNSGAEASILVINLTTLVPGDRCNDTGMALGSARYGTSAIYNVSSDTAYIFGGMDGTGTHLADIVKWPRLGVPVNFGILPSERSFTSAVWDETENRSYIFGGEDTAFQPLNEIVEFQDVLGVPVVRVLSNARLPSPRSATSAVFDGTYAYVIGGRSPNEILSQIVRFNPNGDWKVGVQVMCPDIPGRLENSSAVMSVDTLSQDSGIFVIGGRNETVERREIWHYVPSYWDFGS